MTSLNICDKVVYIGVEDREIDLFENQYKLDDGIKYNSYLIKDKKIAIMDTVDKREINQWEKLLLKELKEEEPDYLICLHVEPDHCGGIELLLNKYTELKIVGNIKTFKILEQFIGEISNDRKVIVKEGDKLDLGSISLEFYLAPLVHWPEVMVAYDGKNGILYSADAFGSFGCEEPDIWLNEARRYYTNIVGKYGVSVQKLIEKVKTKNIKVICPLHGQVLLNNIDYYISKYDKWSKYESEQKGIIIAYASIHGNTENAVYLLKSKLENASDIPVIMIDLARDDLSLAISLCFCYDTIVLAASSYDGGVFPCMETFLNKMKAKNVQNKRIAYIENGSWGPTANRAMKNLTKDLKGIDEMDIEVSIKSTLDVESLEQINLLVEELLVK